MSTYDITLTDPLSSGFTIQPGAFDGPGGSRSNTTLRLYGRGALEWGEAVDENLVRLAETFAGSTPPLTPIQGQLWMRVRYYWKDTSLAATSGWWTYNPTTKTWSRLNGTGVVASAAPTNPTIGSYYYNTADQRLYRWDTAYKQAGAAWLRRDYSESNLSGTAPTNTPENELRVWDGFANGGAGAWVAPLTVVTRSTTPTDQQIGTMWFDTATGKLKVWTGTQWSEILGPSNGAVSTSSGDINMGTYQITNLTSGTIVHGNTGAVTGGAVYDYVASSVNALSGVYLPLSGGTVTGSLTVTGGTTINGATSLNSLTVTGTTNLNGGTTNIANLTIGTSINANSHRILGVSTPTASTDAANKAYVDSSISTAIGGLGGITGSNVSMIATGGAYKAGDVCIVSGKIYIAVGSGTGLAPSGSWRQVFPAIYS